MRRTFKGGKMEIKTFVSKSPRDFDISLNWDTLLVCNQKCSYCYARPSRLWGKIQPREVTEKVIDSIRKSPYTFKICLLGGEPTLHPRIWAIINELQRLKNVKYIELFTNSKKILHPKLSDFSKLNFNLSFHVEEEPDLDVFRTNIEFCKNNDIPFKVFLMIIQNEKYLKQCKIVHDSLPNVVCHYITTNDVTSAKIRFSDESEDTFLVNDKEVKISEILNNIGTIYSFRGLNCDLSDYTVNVDGSIDNMCRVQVGNINNFEFKKHSVICDKECTNACWMETRKWR